MICGYHHVDNENLIIIISGEKTKTNVKRSIHVIPGSGSEQVLVLPQIQVSTGPQKSSVIGSDSEIW